MTRGRRSGRGGRRHGGRAAAESLRLAGECLGRARRVASAGQEELAAAELRVASGRTGQGRRAQSTPDDVLDRIFSRFCVGK